MNNLRRFLGGLILCYLVFILLVLVVSLVIPQAEARGVLRSLFGILLFPVLGLLPLSLLLQRRRLVLLLALVVVVWIAIYGPLLLPRSISPTENGQQFTILTFNIQTASQNLDSLSQIIAQADADIVALQELSEAAAQHLEQDLAATYPYRALHPNRNPHWGQGMMSRFPIDNHEYWRNEQIDVAQGHMWAELNLNGQIITVFSTHPVPPLSFEKGITLQPHSQEIAILLAKAAEHDTPLLLVGDFNMTQLMDEYRQVTEQYTDTYREAGSSGLGFSFPAGHRLPLPPVVRLDYIFHSSHFQGLNAYPLARSGVSDHLPFWAELTLVK